MADSTVRAFHQARNVVIVCVGLVFLWWFGVPIEGQVPLLGVKVPSVAFPYTIGSVLAYGVYSLLIGWFQSDANRRRLSTSRIDLFVTLLLAAAAAWVLQDNLLSTFKLPSVYLLIVGGLLVALGVGGGTLAATLVWLFRFVRSKEEARRLALPRFPVVLRATSRWAFIIVPLFVLTIALSPFFEAPLSNAWPWLLFTPVVVLLVAEGASQFQKTRTLSDGTKISRSENFDNLRKIFAQHDAAYQQSGWDKPIVSKNSPLYSSSERGDIATVRQYLAEGANLDEPNELGWTALMIATAQGHEVRCSPRIGQ